MYGINGKWSIWIVGLTKTDSDNNIIMSLQTYGIVAAVVRLPSPEQKNIVIVEFDSEILTAIFELNSPFQIPNMNNTTVTWHVDHVKVLIHLLARP